MDHGRGMDSDNGALAGETKRVLGAGRCKHALRAGTRGFAKTTRRHSGNELNNE